MCQALEELIQEERAEERRLAEEKLREAELKILQANEKAIQANEKVLQAEAKAIKAKQTTLFQLVSEKLLSVSDAASRLDLTIEQFCKEMTAAGFAISAEI